MAINKNHEFEDLDSIKCAIVEKNVSPERMAFLKNLLVYNEYKLVIVESPASKVETPEETIHPITYTVGVTDLTFNAINAVFGRLLHTVDGHIVTLSYWQQKDAVSDDSIPYFDHP